MDIIDFSRHIGNFDPDPFMDFIRGLPDEAWDEFTDRQDRFEAHSHTKTLAAIFPDRKNFPDTELVTYTYTEAMRPFWDDLARAFAFFYKAEFMVTSAMVVQMAPQSEVLSHTDTHPYFGHTHRAHWCLSGDYKAMDFMISGDKIPMKKGDFVEINNRMPHAVAYRGDVPRFNFIVDFLPV